MTYPGAKLEGVDGAGASVRGCPPCLGAVQAAPSTSPERAAGAPGLIPGGFGSRPVDRTYGPGFEGKPWVAEHGTSPGGRLHTRYPDQGALLVLARTKAGDCFARRVLPPTEALALACRWVEACPGMTVELVRA